MGSGCGISWAMVSVSFSEVQIMGHVPKENALLRLPWSSYCFCCVPTLRINEHDSLVVRSSKSIHCLVKKLYFEFVGPGV